MLRFALLAVLWLLVSNAAQAQYAPAVPATPLPSPHAEGDEGSLGAELGGAILGDVLGGGITAITIMSTMSLCWEYCEDEPADPIGLWAATFALRPILVGGLSAAFGRRSGGQGRVWASMLGALPGTALIAGGWLIAGGTESAGGGIAVVLAGHMAVVGGSVLAYRHSAHNHPRARRELSQRARARTRFVPGPLVDHRSGTYGLALSGSF